jgi:hypothetical protein
MKDGEQLLSRGRFFEGCEFAGLYDETTGKVL